MEDISFLCIRLALQALRLDVAIWFVEIISHADPALSDKRP